MKKAQRKIEKLDALRRVQVAYANDMERRAREERARAEQLQSDYLEQARRVSEMRGRLQNLQTSELIREYAEELRTVRPDDVRRASKSRECDICFEDTNTFARLFDCEHEICADCAIRWSSCDTEKRACPFCRNAMKSAYRGKTTPVSSFFAMRDRLI